MHIRRFNTLYKGLNKKFQFYKEAGEVLVAMLLCKTLINSLKLKFREKKKKKKKNNRQQKSQNPKVIKNEEKSVKTVRIPKLSTCN